MPAFAITPESTAVTSGGASRYVSGSQPWNGKSGALITNANMKPRKIQRLALGGAVDEVERAGLQAVDDERGEHQERARHRVDEELHRRAEPAGAAPDADEDVERDQHRLEERVEEEQVLRDEDADGRAGEEEHQPEVRARPVAADPEAVADRGRHRDDGEPDEPEREAVLADVVRDAEVA